MLKITFFQRRPYDFHFSIEKLFDTIRQHLSPAISQRVFTLPYYSVELLPRIKSALAARKNQGAINHITGDIHFITPFLKKNKTINTYHDFTFLQSSSGIKRFVLWFFWVYLPVKYSRYITVISQATKQELLALTKCSPAKVVVIPNIIPSDFAYRAKEFNHTQPTILHIGTTPNKNLHRLIEAIEGITCKLVIIGKLRPEIVSLLNKKSIHYENRFQISDAELVQEYVNCDVLSFCSLNEGFGLPILEAQATGRAVITSKVSSMPEVAGDGACLVNPYDVNAIKAGIQKVISDDHYRQQLIAKGLENVKRFKPKTVAGQYEALYKKLMSTPA